MICHDDVIKWNIFRVTGPLCGEFTGHRWIPRTEVQWRGALIFSLICAWINGWVNNGEAGDLRRHRPHYDVTVMFGCDAPVLSTECLTRVTAPELRSASNHHQLDCWFSSLFDLATKKTSKVHITWSLWGESTGGFPSRRPCHAGRVYISWYLIGIHNTSQWRHNGRDGVSNHQPHDCLLNRLFGRISKKTSKLRVTGLCAENSPWTGEFPAEMASNAENVFIWWRHHELPHLPWSN